MNLPQNTRKAPHLAPTDPATTTEGISPHRLAYLMDRWAVYNLKASNGCSTNTSSIDIKARELARAVPELVKEIRRLDDLLHGRCE